MMDDLIHVERSLQMVNTNVRMMPTNPSISQHKEMHIFDPYRNSTGTYCMQRRHQSRLCKNKNHPRLETPSQSKAGQSVIRTYDLLQNIHLQLCFDYRSVVTIVKEIQIL